MKEIRKFLREVRKFLEMLRKIIREPNASTTLPFLACIFVCITLMEAMWFFN